MFRNVVRMLLLAGLSVAPAATASAQTTGVFVVHGIPGEGGFPVDVSVNGACALEGLTFGQIAGAVPLVGTFDIAVYADLGGSCQGSPALGPVALTFEAGKSYSVVAHLTETGAPTAALFQNDLGPLHRGSTRVIAHHAAAAPAVDLTVARSYYGGGRSPRSVVEDFVNGQQSPSVVVRPGDWQVAIAPAGGTAPVFGPVTLTLEPYRTYLVYAVGSLADGTFTPLIKAVPVAKAGK